MSILGPITSTQVCCYLQLYLFVVQCSIVQYRAV